MGQPSGDSQMFAPGCARTVPLKEQADAYEDQPETLYHGLRPTNWWSDGQARRTRKDCPARTISPATEPYPPRCCRASGAYRCCSASSRGTFTAARLPENRARKRVVQGKSVSVRVAIGGRRHLKKKKRTNKQNQIT